MKIKYIRELEIECNNIEEVIEKIKFLNRININGKDEKVLEVYKNRKGNIGVVIEDSFLTSLSEIGISECDNEKINISNDNLPILHKRTVITEYIEEELTILCKRENIEKYFKELNNRIGEELLNGYISRFYASTFNEKCYLYIYIKTNID